MCLLVFLVSYADEFIMHFQLIHNHKKKIFTESFEYIKCRVEGFVGKITVEENA